MPTKLILFLSGSGLFLIFVFFSFLVHEDLFTQFDFNTTVRLQDNIPRRVDGVFSLLSDIGKFEIMIITLIVFFAVLRKWLAGFVAFVLFGFFHVIELFGKFFVDHPPPPHFMLRTETIVDFPQFYVSSEFSYPSGHSGRAAFLSVVIIIVILNSKKLSPLVKTLLCAAVVGYDALMFVSRVYLGEHWSTDVIGGALLGGSFGLLTGIFLVGESILKILKRKFFHPRLPGRKITTGG
jgi:membrane-associated phospholipid phosphatase